MKELFSKIYILRKILMENPYGQIPMSTEF